MALSRQNEKKACAMVRAGKSIVEVASALDADYPEIQRVCAENGLRGWIGSKNIISRRLKSLKTATTAAKRAELVDEIQSEVDYLYYCAKDSASKLDRIQKALG